LIQVNARRAFRISLSASNAGRPSRSLEPFVTIDPAILSSLAALGGALVGGGTTFLSTVYAQRNQDRRERVRHEIAKREAVYAEFIVAATTVLAKATVTDLDDFEAGADEQRLFGLGNRIGLFASPAVVQEAEKVMRLAIEIGLKPRIGVRAAATEALATGGNQLLPFSRVCREDLDSLERTITSVPRARAR
jgi:hypothetical protein